LDLDSVGRFMLRHFTAVLLGFFHIAAADAAPALPETAL
jgi:hypothetical protein